jgi:hypothetical protein
VRSAVVDLLASHLHSVALRNGLPGLEVPVEMREEARRDVNPEPMSSAEQIRGDRSFEADRSDRARLEEAHFVLALAVAGP